MYRFILLCLLFVVFAQGSNAQTSRIITYGELIEALRTGHTVRSTFYYGKCDLIVAGKKSDKSPDIVRGMTVNLFDQFGRNTANNPKAFVVFSETKLIENPNGEGYVHDYVKVRVYEDGQVTIIARHLDPTTHKNLIEQQFETSLYDGQSKTSGAYFFVGN